MVKKKNNSHKATPPKNFLGLTKTKRSNVYKFIGVIASIITIFLFSIWLLNEDKLDRIIILFENIQTSLNPRRLPEAPIDYDKIKKEVEIELKAKGYINPEILLKMGNIEFAQNNLVQSINYYEVAKSLVAKQETKEDKKIYAVASGNLGLVYRIQGDIKKAFKYQNDALLVYRDLEDITGEAVTLDNIGSIHFYTGNYTKSLQLYKEALNLHKITKNYHQIAFENDNIGNLYYTRGKPDSAMLFFKDALVLNRIIPDSIGIAYDFLSISSIFNSLDEIDSAKLYLDTALFIYQNIGYKQGIAVATCNTGGLYIKIDSLEIALDYLNEAIGLSQNKFISVEADCLRYLGIIEKQKGEFNKALIAHQKALALYKKIPNPLGVAYQLSNIGNIYIEMKKYTDALNSLYRAKILFEKLELIIEVVKTQKSIDELKLF